jgi:hypothetical protein
MRKLLFHIARQDLLSDDEEEEELQPQASSSADDWRLPTDMEGWGKLPHVM